MVEQDICKTQDQNAGGMSPMVTVIIPSYNRGHLLERTVPTYLQERVGQLIIVDDCSTDNTTEVVERLRKQFPQIEYVRNERNIKQAASKNRGIERARGEFIYFGDDDSLLLPGSIGFLFETIEQEDAGAVMARPLVAGPNYEEEHAEEYIRWRTGRGHTGRVDDIYNVSTLSFNWGRWMDHPIDVPCMPACMLVRTELARATMFDPAYVGCAYREETDFSFRLSLDHEAKLMYDARAVQLNLPDYMVRLTGARAGGYEVWRQSAIACNRYFLQKLWPRIAEKYNLSLTVEEMQREFERQLADKAEKSSVFKRMLKNLYFDVFVYKRPHIAFLLRLWPVYGGGKP